MFIKAALKHVKLWCEWGIRCKNRQSDYSFCSLTFEILTMKSFLHSITVGIVEKFFVRGASINSVPFLDIIQIIVFLFARNVTKSSRKSNRYSARDYARVTDFRTRREGCSRFSVGEDGHTKNYRQRARDCCSCQGNGCQHAIMRTSSLNESMQKAARWVASMKVILISRNRDKNSFLHGRMVITENIPLHKQFHKN